MLNEIMHAEKYDDEIASSFQNTHLNLNHDQG